VNTVGGGVIVDAKPPRSSAALPDSAAAGEPSAGVVLKLGRAGLAGRTPAELGSELGLAPAELDAEVGRLVAEEEIVSAAGSLFERGTWDALGDHVEDLLDGFHREQPLRPGMSREELRGRVARAMPREAWRAWLEAAERDGRVRLEGERVALAGHRVSLSAQDQACADRIQAEYRRAGLDPPDLDRVLEREGDRQRAERLVDLLIESGELVRLRDGRLVHGGALEELRGKLREYAERSRMIDVAAFKELAGVTRKNAIPLLEFLDAERTTRRVGNKREILNPQG
jgi:selenocysteine-specific elongation factor